MRLNSPGSCHDSHLGRGEGNVGREILVLNEDPVTALRSGDDHTDCPSPPQEGGVAASTGQGLGPFVVGAGVNAQGYVANWNNDVIFPAIGVGPDGTSGAMVYTLTGNTNFPSVAVSNVSDLSPVSKIPVVLAGKDVLDDFAWYLFGTPRFGDYSAAVGDGHTVYLGAEYVQDACDTNTYLSDLSFGVFPCTSLGTPRGVFSNWGTGLVKVNL